MIKVESVCNGDKELVAVKCGGTVIGWVLDYKGYLAGNVANRIQDMLENNVYSAQPRTLEEMKLFIRESLSEIEGALSAVTDRDIEAMSWYLGNGVTLFYHGRWVERGKFVAADEPCDISDWFSVMCETKGRSGGEYKRWRYNHLLIGKDLQDIIARLKKDESIRRYTQT